MENNNGDGGTVRLPLWRSALDEMLDNGVEHNQIIESEWFEKRLRTTRDTMAFGLGVSEIRRELETHGYYLSGRGHKGTQFIILPPENNADVMNSYQRAAIDALRRGVILGTHTRIDMLKDADRRRHEALLEKIGFRSVLIARSQTIKKVIEKHAPKLLKAAGE